MKNDEGRRSKRALLKSFSAYVISYTTRSRPGFSTRTLLFLVDPEKARSGATVRQRRIDAQIHRTKHIRRQRIHTTGADSSGSFLRRTCQTLNASKSVRIWTPNRAEVDRCVSRPRARAAVRTTGAYFSRLAPCCSLWTPKSRVWALRYGNAELSRKYAGPNTSSAIHTHYWRWHMIDKTKKTIKNYA